MNILILSPHTDDGEYHCGGTIARFIEEKKEVLYVAFSTAEKSVPPEFPANILKAEVKEATKILGIKEENLVLFNYEVRDFPLHRQEILDNLIHLKREFKPSMVLLPSTYDTHQDHQVIAQEGFRAFKDVTMMGYEAAFNNLTFSANVFISLTKEQMRVKIEACKCYHSQTERSTCSTAFYENLAQVRGAQIGADYAEAFEAIRWVMR